MDNHCIGFNESLWVSSEDKRKWYYIFLWNSRLSIVQGSPLCRTCITLHHQSIRCFYMKVVLHVTATKSQKIQKFSRVRFPNRNTSHNLNTVRTTGVLADGKPKHHRRVLTEEKLNEIRAQLEHSPCLLNCTRNGCIERIMRTATKLVTLWPYKVRAVYSLQSCDCVARLNFRNWYLRSVGTFKNLSLSNQSTDKELRSPGITTACEPGSV
jgi:hypothetical protein